MKLIIIVLAVVTGSALAYDITGVAVLKGSLKTKTYVKGVETTCRVEIKKVKNLLEEDSNGNPAYTVRTNVSLDGSDSKRKITIKVDRDVELTNMFQSGTIRTVKDLEYASTDGVRLFIKEDGRMRLLQYPYEGQTLNCNF